MKVSNTRTSLSQESVAILSVGGVLLGTAVALGALILTTTERIEERIGRVEHRIERVEDRLLAAEKEIASLRVDIAGLRLSIERLEPDVTSMSSGPSDSRS